MVDMWALLGLMCFWTLDNQPILSLKVGGHGEVKKRCKKANNPPKSECRFILLRRIYAVGTPYPTQL